MEPHLDIHMHTWHMLEQLVPIGMHIIKSPQSGVTLCFQFVSAAAAAMTFASHVKTVWASP